MKKEVKIHYGNGTSVLTVLGIIFVVLKWLRVITWSWGVVLLPFIIQIALLILLLIIFVVLAIASGNR